MDMPRKKLTITLPEDFLEWVDQEVSKNVVYRDRSHFFEILVHKERMGSDNRQQGK